MFCLVKVSILIGSVLWGLSLSANSSHLPKVVQSVDKTLNEYSKLHESFFKEVCRPGVEQKFWKLNFDFKGDGHYIPMTVDDKLDRDTILKHLPELRKKLVWIDSLIENLRKIPNMALILQELHQLEEKLKILLEYQHRYFESTNKEEKIKLEQESKTQISLFKKELETFYRSVFFLLSYEFPVDHFSLRQEYDRYKSSEKPDDRLKSNDVYFYRQIVQDGAQDTDHQRSDKFLRSVLDTVFLELNKHSDPFISEDLRYDLQTIFNLVKVQLQRGLQNQLSRMEEWRERTHRAIMFYTGLINNNVQRGEGETETGDQIVNKLAKARYALKEFNFQRQKEVYRFWKDQSELMKALFVIETILYNEVGSIDGRDGLERRDVIQIVLNRFHHDFYSSLSPKDGLYSYLSFLKPSDLEKERWLNLLFKDGEFSFTYFFINSSLRVYCPDRSRSGRWLRRQNLEMAIELLKKPREDFEALRYYSRHSMQGRMRMDQLWSQYESIPERPGRELKNPLALKKRKAAGQYQFLYHFDGADKERYEVLEIGETIVVYRKRDQKLYTWRNPHLFRYFRPVTTPRP